MKPIATKIDYLNLRNERQHINNNKVIKWQIIRIKWERKTRKKTNIWKITLSSNNSKLRPPLIKKIKWNSKALSEN